MFIDHAAFADISKKTFRYRPTISGYVSPHPSWCHVFKQQEKREKFINCNTRLQADYFKLQHIHVVQIEISLKLIFNGPWVARNEK